jgi:hypothetical protein
MSTRLTWLAALTALPSSLLLFAACVGDNPSGAFSTDHPSTDAATADSAGGGSSDAMVSSDASSTDADGAPPFTPAALDAKGSLALWLEASQNVSLDQGQVAIWGDLSKNKNDALGNVSGRPAVAHAAIHGHDAVDFGAVNTYVTVADAVSLQFGADEIAIFGVAKYSGPAGRAFLYSKASYPCSSGLCTYAEGPELFIGEDADAQASLVPEVRWDTNYSGSWNASVFTNNGFHLVGLRRNGQNVTLYVDGATQNVVLNLAGASEAGQPLVIGARHLGTFMPTIDFQLAELVVVHAANGIVTDGDVDPLVAYLRSKYAL